MERKKQTHFKNAVTKELKVVGKQEMALRRLTENAKTPQWKTNFTDKIPEKIYINLQKAFCTAFSIIFEKGTGIIEKTYNRESIHEDYEIQEFAFKRKANRKELKKMRKSVGVGNRRNMAMTSVEGIGLGALGIGLPDIVLFVGILLKGIYEVAGHYGFEYESEEERRFILKLMETSMLKGKDWDEANSQIDTCIAIGLKEYEWPENRESQIARTANVFSVDMLLLKFVQGLPLVGAIGGVGNPVYYSKVMKYVELKYRKRYLMKLQKNFVL